jgi:hypothetical protein
MPHGDCAAAGREASVTAASASGNSNVQHIHGMKMVFGRIRLTLAIRACNGTPRDSNH